MTHKGSCHYQFEKPCSVDSDKGVGGTCMAQSVECPILELSSVLTLGVVSAGTGHGAYVKTKQNTS